jgi:hypothetical protein
MSTPPLHDDRIQKMRMTVMHRVDQDVTRRGRRARRVVGLSVASVLVVGLGSYALGSLGGDDQVTASDSGAAGSSAAPAPGIPERASLGEQDDAADGTTPQAPDISREVVTTGTVRVTVRDPRATARQLSAWVESIGGRVDDRSETGSGDDASASVTVRVPSGQVTGTIDRLRTDGRVDDVSVQNTDVTAQAKDLDARIDALQLSIDRLTSIMAGAGSSKDLLSAERALTDRQEQLESLQAQRKAVADQVSLSTLTIDLSQTPTAESVEPGGFGGGLRDGWNAMVSTLNAVVQVAGIVLPWAAVVLVLAVVTRLATRRRGTPR